MPTKAIINAPNSYKTNWRFLTDAKKSDHPPRIGKNEILRIISNVGNESPAVQLMRIAGINIPRKKTSIVDTIIGTMPVGSGVIRGAGEVPAEVRQIIRQEYKKRGPGLLQSAEELMSASGVSKKLPAKLELINENLARLDKMGIENTSQYSFLDENPWFSKILRGTWFHGRKTYPKRGSTFAGARSRIGNLGEPTGISLTKNPELFKKHFARLPDKLKKLIQDLSDQYSDLYIGRMVADEATKIKIEKKMQQNKAISDYLRSINKWPVARTAVLYGGPPEKVILPAWKGPGTEWAQQEIKDAYANTLQGIIRRRLRAVDQGPYAGSKSLRHAVQEAENIRELKTALLGTGWRDRNLQRVLNKRMTKDLVNKGYKGVLYHPKRFSEYELRMFDPDNVLMVDKRSPVRGVLKSRLSPHETSAFMPTKRNIEKWKNAYLYKGASLRDIYKDIDVRKLVGEVMREF